MKLKVVSKARKTIVTSSSWLAFRSTKRRVFYIFLFSLFYILIFDFVFKNVPLQKDATDNFFEIIFKLSYSGILLKLSYLMVAACVLFYIHQQIPKQEKIDSAQPQIRAAAVNIISLIDGIISNLKIQQPDSTPVTQLEIEKWCAEIESNSAFFDPDFPTKKYDSWDNYFTAQITELRIKIEALLLLHDTIDGAMLKVLTNLSEKIIKSYNSSLNNNNSYDKTSVSKSDRIISLYKLNKELKKTILKQDRRLLNNIMREFRQ